MGHLPPNFADEPTAVEPVRPAQPAQSAWTQHANTSIVPGSRPVQTSKWPLLIAGGAVVLVAALIVTVVLVTSGGSGRGPARSVAGGPAAPTSTVKVFTNIPSDSCELISAFVLSTYAPQAKCSLHTNKKNQTGLENWDNSAANQSLIVHLHVDMTVASYASETYDSYKESDMGSSFTVTGQHAVSGVGDKAYVAYGADQGPPASGQAALVVLDGNAALELTYDASTVDQDFNFGTVPRQQTEAAVTAIAKDILGHLS